MSDPMKLDVTFLSETTPCSGWYYRPEGDGPFAAIAMAHGMGAVKEMYLEPYARAFAAAGIAVLLFDYRYWGASGGVPRSQAIPNAQIEDYRSALTWLSVQDAVDPSRLGVWGTSFSGGTVLHLGAYDVRVKAVVSQIGAMDVYAAALAGMGRERFDHIRMAAAKDREAIMSGAAPTYIRNATTPEGPPGFLVSADTVKWLEEAQTTVAPNVKNELTLASLEQVLQHSPALSVHRVSPTPLLMFLAKEDQIVPPQHIRDAYDHAGQPKRLIELPGGHYDVYQAGEAQSIAIKEATAWFSEHLNV